MNYVINNQVVLSRVSQGPISVYIGGFLNSMNSLNSLNSLGYAPHYIHQQVRLAACFSHWLKQTRVRLRSITSDHPQLYLRYRYRHQRPWRGDAAALKNLIDFLRREGVIPSEKVAVHRLAPIENCTQAYETYLREARALAKATIVNYVPFIRDLLNNCFGDGRVTLSKLCAGDVVRFVQRPASSAKLAYEAGQVNDQRVALFPELRTV